MTEPIMKEYRPYIIITANSPDELAESVSTSIGEDGYSPSGGIAIESTSAGNNLYYQAMVHQKVVQPAL